MSAPSKPSEPAAPHADSSSATSAEKKPLVAGARSLLAKHKHDAATGADDEKHAAPTPALSAPTAPSSIGHENAALPSGPSQASADAAFTMFTSELALRSFRLERDNDTGARTRGRFHPWTGYAAVIFVDVSGYSKLAEAVAGLGAHALAGVVNGYFERLLEVVKNHDGDVVKFAGDAVIAVWPVERGADDEPEQALAACSSAARCALALQRNCGSHEYSVPAAVDPLSGCMASIAVAAAALTPGALDEADMAAKGGVRGTLGIHVGVSYGPLRSEVLTPPTPGGSADTPVLLRGAVPMASTVSSTLTAEFLAQSNAQAYHFIGGTALVDVSACVEAAPTGEICVSADCASRLPSPHAAGSTRTSPAEGNGGAKFQLEAVDLKSNTSDNEGEDDAADNSALVFRLNVGQCDAFEDSVAVVADDNDLSGNPAKSAAPAKAAPREDAALLAPDDTAARAQVAARFVLPLMASRLAAGTSAADMIELRPLTILFIAKVSRAPVKLWFNAVAATLSRFGVCLIQAIDDDKGVHVTAAINFEKCETDPTETALRVCYDLTRSTGSVVGAAAGSCFAGTIGGAGAVRADFSGWAAVRACRLMQYAQAQHAVRHGNSVARRCQVAQRRASAQAGEVPRDDTGALETEPLAVFDASVASRAAASQLSLRKLEEKLTLKGAAEPVEVYTLSYLMGRGAEALSCIPNVRHAAPDIHQAYRAAFAATILAPLLRGGNGARAAQSRSGYQAADALAASAPTLIGGGVVFGPAAAGKRTLAISSLQQDSVFAPVVHTVSLSDGPLAAVKSLATYLSYVPMASVRSHAQALRTSAERVDAASPIAQHEQTLLMIDLCVATVEAGLHIALVVLEAHRLSSEFLELVDGVCQHSHVELTNLSSAAEVLPVRGRGEAAPTASASAKESWSLGRFAFVFVAAPLIDGKSAEELAAPFRRSLPAYADAPPIVRVPKMGPADMSASLRVWGGDIFTMAADGDTRSLDTFIEVSDSSAAAFTEAFGNAGVLTRFFFMAREVAIAKGEMPESSRLMRGTDTSFEFSEELICVAHQRHLMHRDAFPRYSLRVWERIDRTSAAQQSLLHCMAAVDEPYSVSSQWLPGQWLLEVTALFLAAGVTNNDDAKSASQSRSALSRSRRGSKAQPPASASGSASATANDAKASGSASDSAASTLKADVSSSMLPGIDALRSCGLLDVGLYSSADDDGSGVVQLDRPIEVADVVNPLLALRIAGRHVQAAFMAKAPPLMMAAGIAVLVGVAEKYRGMEPTPSGSPAFPQTQDLAYFSKPRIADDLCIAGMWLMGGRRDAALEDLAAACARYIEEVGEEAALKQPRRRDAAKYPRTIDDPRYMLWDFATRVMCLSAEECTKLKVPAFEFISLADAAVEAAPEDRPHHIPTARSVGHSERLNDLEAPLMVGPLAGILNAIAHNLLVQGLRNVATSPTAPVHDPGRLRTVTVAHIRPAVEAVHYLIGTNCPDKTKVKADAALLTRLSDFKEVASTMEQYDAAAGELIAWVDGDFRGYIDALNELAGAGSTADSSEEANAKKPKLEKLSPSAASDVAPKKPPVSLLAVANRMQSVLEMLPAVDPDADPNGAATADQGVRRALARLCEPLASASSDAEPTTHRAVAEVEAMRDALMELAAVNWWTGYHYQIPGAVRDLWVEGDMSMAEVRLMLAAHVGFAVAAATACSA